MEAPASCWLPAAEAPLELLPRVMSMLGALCGVVMCKRVRAISCLCVAVASVELYLVECLSQNEKKHRFCPSIYLLY